VMTTTTVIKAMVTAGGRPNNYPIDSGQTSVAQRDTAVVAERQGWEAGPGDSARSGA